MQTLINIQKCRIQNDKEIFIKEFSCQIKATENWLVIGPNGGGKADFLNALSGNLKFIKNQDDSILEIPQPNDLELVSLEKAARIIQEERENDESEYLEGGVDIGRTGKVFIAQSLKNPDEINQIENLPEIQLCGIQHILERGLKYMSTGEIRRTLLAKALISKKKLLILSDPFAGIDVESRKILLDFFTQMTNPHAENHQGTQIILCMERWNEIPQTITHVIEFSNKEVSFCGERKDYEIILKKRKAESENQIEKQKQDFEKELNQTLQETFVLQNEKSDSEDEEILVEMKNVNVGWDGRLVLENLNWTLKKHEHWLIRGPNGCGKTTFLELITGDNKQVYSNDIWIFGIKRGSGESIWDIKKRLGIVSYRLHVEYRMIGGISLQNVIISGFRDSIGLYGDATDVEKDAAKKWLKLGGFINRENELFSNLSYGEQRAILILRAAVKCPEILILDEPCHGLDEENRRMILHLLDLIAENKTSTLLHVTHDMNEVLKCEKHILEMEKK